MHAHLNQCRENLFYSLLTMHVHGFPYLLTLEALDIALLATAREGESSLSDWYKNEFLRDEKRCWWLRAKVGLKSAISSSLPSASLSCIVSGRDTSTAELTGERVS